MSGVLAGKVAVVTGGTSGIGAAVAARFRDEGATVVVIGSSPAKVDAARAGGFDAVACDVGSVAAVTEAMRDIGKRHARIDVLFACAGIPGRSLKLEAVEEADFDAVVAVNLKGAFFTVQQALPFMGEGGAVILTSSVGAYMAMPISIAYGAAKAGVRSLGRSLAAVLAPRGIRVNVLTPGLFETPLFDAMGDKRDQVIAAIASRVPMRRAADPSEITDAALLLATATFMTGAELKVSGGETDL